MFDSFRQVQFRCTSWPRTVAYPTSFLAHLSIKNLSTHTASVYIAGISYHCKIKNVDDPIQRFAVFSSVNSSIGLIKCTGKLIKGSQLPLICFINLHM